MTHDLELLRLWLRIATVICAVAVTSFPVLYSFKPWKQNTAGRLLMFQGVAFALAIDVSSILSFWRPSNILIWFWADLFILTIISIAVSALTWWMWQTNSPRRK